MNGAREDAGRPGDAAAGVMPRAVFVNLDAAGERRRFMEAQGRRLGLGMERRAATHAAGIAAETVAALNGRWERPLTAGELGCFLSHRALWREIAAGADPVLVLEDDVMLSRRLGDVLPLLAALAGIDFLNLESFDRRRIVARKAQAVTPDLSILRAYRDKSGSAAYLLWPAGARKLLRRAERGAAPVDAFLHGAAELRSWQSEPALAMQLHVLERRGRAVPIPSASFIQLPRKRLSLAPVNAPFHARRVRTQARLGLAHLMRLFGRRYRLVDIVEADFDQSSS